MRAWFVVAGLCALAACSSKPSTGTLAPATTVPPAAGSNSSAPAPSPSPAGFKVGDRVQTSSGNFVTLYGYNPAVPLTGSGILAPPSPGVTLVAVDVQGCAGPNPEGGSATMDPLFFTLKMSDNTTATPDIFNTAEPNLTTQTLPPGQCDRGMVTYDVPAGEHPAALVMSTGLSDVVTWSLGS